MNTQVNPRNGTGFRAKDLLFLHQMVDSALLAEEDQENNTRWESTPNSHIMGMGSHCQRQFIS